MRENPEHSRTPRNAALEVRTDMHTQELAARQGPRLRGILGLALLLLAMLGAPAGAADFVVIINGANPIAAMSAREVSNLFLKKSAHWPDGIKAAPVDLDEGAAARESFSKAVHHKSTTAVKSYWQTMIFSGRDIPPPEKPAAGEVLAFVRANRGAIGYLPAGTPLGAGVKVLEVTP
jgi:hypothetical protein